MSGVVRHGKRLSPSGLIQRDVDVSLNSAFFIPIRFAMADYANTGCHQYCSVSQINTNRSTPLGVESIYKYRTIILNIRADYQAMFNGGGNPKWSLIER